MTGFAHEALDKIYKDQVTDCSLVLIKLPGTEKYLGVTRKDDHSDVGLPGGKREMGESFHDCAVREALEETGYTIRLLPAPSFKATEKSLMYITFLAEITSADTHPLDPSETGVVGFFNKQAFLEGSFGDYNEKMFKHFDI